MEERRTSPIELLWDLVFLFAVTQVTTLLASDLSWPGFGRAMLVLALVWWAWSANVWTNLLSISAKKASDTCLARRCYLAVERRSRAPIEAAYQLDQ